LEVEAGFEATLGDFGLIWGVLGVPTGVLKDVAKDDAGCVGAVVASSDEGAIDAVVGGEGGETFECGGFTQWFGEAIEGEWTVEADGAGDSGGGKGFERGKANAIEHFSDFGVVRADVAMLEDIER